jgi:hypothetical protein
VDEVNDGIFDFLITVAAEDRTKSIHVRISQIYLRVLLLMETGDWEMYIGSLPNRLGTIQLEMEAPDREYFWDEEDDCPF